MEKPGGVTVSLLRGAGQPLPALWVSVSTDRTFNWIPGVSYNARALLRPLPIVGAPLPSLSPVERSSLKNMAIGQPPAPVDPTERARRDRNLQTMLDRLFIAFTRCDACQVLAVPIQAGRMDDKKRD